MCLFGFVVWLIVLEGIFVGGNDINYWVMVMCFKDIIIFVLYLFSNIGR